VNRHPQVPLAREATSRDGLAVRVVSPRNPYAYLFSHTDLVEFLLDLAQRRAESIWAGHHTAAKDAPRGTYERACMASVVLDPTAPPRAPNAQAVLAAITIGTGGARFLPNAAAKAAGHRRLGHNYGEAVHVDPHLCGDAAFRYGHSARVRGVIVGSSAQSTDQDLYEAAAFAHDFVAGFRAHHLRWERSAGAGEWMTVPDHPGPEPAEMVGFYY
jgi:hypothetical protein